MDLKIEYVPKEDLKPYANNAKLHPSEQIEQIKKSIAEFGFNDPVAVWHDNEIVEGHGRLLAVMEMDDIDKIPIIRLDDLTDEQRKAYMLVHNKLTMNTDFDYNVLEEELRNIINIDMSEFSFSIQGVNDSGEENKEKYTTTVKLPQYVPSDNLLTVSELIDTGKCDDLIRDIEESGLTHEEKEFLKICAYRHAVINFRSCADYYASASAEMQKLMEQNALVFIDVDDAIANGFAKLSSTLESIMEQETNE